ncbi:RloB domain-containing protein [Streptomyces sp. GMY01]|uniref:RloB family protein n=1 Tax=Streptomyces sp. GMY02 TaxID=1333528 RepID=UPI00146AE664|nr:RloB family protein [Streptomyces sp. GMY02]NMO37963.1 RloB domain-containing protein [Streptomyces sp. GMY02]
MGRGKPLKRSGAKRPELRRVLIYCEGECTERHYLTGLRSELSGLPVQVEVGPEHGVPTALVRAAVKHKERAPRSRQDRFTAYDEVWCVMDVEAPRPHPDLGPALTVARRNGIKVALSNPCFELWLLLHFREVRGYNTSDAAQRLLEQHEACGYRRDRKHLDFAPFRSAHPMAAARARALRAAAGRGHAENPWTDVDLLVDGLLDQARTARG